MVTIIMRAWEMPTSDNLALGAADTPVVLVPILFEAHLALPERKDRCQIKGRPLLVPFLSSL